MRSENFSTEACCIPNHSLENNGRHVNASLGVASSPMVYSTILSLSPGFRDANGNTEHKCLGWLVGDRDEFRSCFAAANPVSVLLDACSKLRQMRRGARRQVVSSCMVPRHATWIRA